MHSIEFLGDSPQASNPYRWNAGSTESWVRCRLLVFDMTESSLELPDAGQLVGLGVGSNLLTLATQLAAELLKSFGLAPKLKGTQCTALSSQ